MLPSITNSAECSKCQTLIPIKTEYDSDPDYKPEEFSGEIDPMQYVGVLHGSDELLKQEPMIGNYETSFKKVKKSKVKLKKPKSEQSFMIPDNNGGIEPMDSELWCVFIIFCPVTTLFQSPKISKPQGGDIWKLTKTDN